MALNRTLPVPLYYQLAELLAAKIRHGELAPGQQLPAERDLSEQYAISRMTVRQALGCLVAEGILTARQGLGTFVAEPKLTANPVHLLSFTEEMLAKGAAPSSRVLEQRLVVPPQPVAAGLELGHRAQAVKIVRLRGSQDLPLLLETVHVPAGLCPGLEYADLATQSLYALFEHTYGLKLDRTRQALESAPANESEADLFGIAAGTPMILLRGITYLAGGRPAEHFQPIYRGDRFKFEFEGQRSAWAGDSSVETLGSPRMSVILR
jgi:GntR family transcriptional regulator